MDFSSKGLVARPVSLAVPSRYVKGKPSRDCPNEPSPTRRQQNVPKLYYNVSLLHLSFNVMGREADTRRYWTTLVFSFAFLPSFIQQFYVIWRPFIEALPDQKPVPRIVPLYARFARKKPVWQLSWIRR